MADPTYFLAPNPRWSAHAQTGFVAAGGKLYTYIANTSIPKATYQTPLGPVGPVNPNPVILDSKGEANIYWASDTLYRIELYTSGGQKIFTQDNYPYTNASGDAPVNAFIYPINLIRNPQFTFWSNTGSFTNIGTESQLADDWVLYRNNTNATISITQETFILGQTDVPANPVSYLHYECTDIGAGGETSKIITQAFKSVQTLANQEISFALWAKSPTSSQLSVDFEQYFGTGGSPSPDVVTNIFSETLTNTWAKYSGTITVPNVNGQTIGTNGDDQVFIDIALPLNAIADIEICNVQLQVGNILTDFPYDSVQGQFGRVADLVNKALFTTGDIKMTFAATAPDGWILMNDGSIGNQESGATALAADETKALFELMWNNVSNSYAVLQNSSGTPIARGATAEDDFNANNRLVLTAVLGRAIASAGTGSGLTARALGQYVGEENHTLSNLEMPIHEHPYVAVVGGPKTLKSGEDENSIGSETGDTGSAGGGQPHNNMQPTVFLNVMIKL